MDTMTERKLLAVSMLEAIHKRDQDMIRILIEEDSMVGTNALVAAVAMIGRLMHTQPFPAGMSTQDFLDQMRENVLQEGSELR